MRIPILLALGCYVSLPAEAAPITYSFTGTVLQVSSFVSEPLSVGQQIPIVITLDANAQATQGSQPGFYFGFTPSLFTTATFAGLDHAGGLEQTVTIVPNVSIDFHVVGLQILFGFDLLLSGALPGALPSADLPLTLDPSQFTQGTFSVTDAFSPIYDGYLGTINLAAVPEPASLAVILGSLLALRAARGRLVARVAGRACGPAPQGWRRLQRRAEAGSR